MPDRHETTRVRKLLARTAKTAAVAAHRESDERFRLLVESVRDYAIFHLDTSGVITSWNRGAERLKGYKANEIIGRHFSIFYPPEKIAARHPQWELRQALKHGRYEEEGWRLRKDGSRFWADVVITALRDKEGRHVGFAKVTRDLTEQRRAAQALRQSEQRQRLLIQSVKDYAIFMLDPNGNVTSWNPGAEQIKGWKAEEIIGRHFSKFYPAEDIESGKPWLELRVAAAEGRFEDEGWRLRKDGSRFWANVVISAVWSEDGSELLGFSKVTRDLTERRRSEEALRRSNEELEQYAAFVSHDLQEPLRKIASFSELLARRYQGKLDEEADQFIAYIVDGAKRMRTLIVDVLEYSRLSHRAPRVDAQADLDKVLAIVRRDLDLSFKEARGKLLIGELPTVRGDGLLLGRVFQNVIGNAVKFRDRRRPLRVGVVAKRRGDRWLIMVRDNGIGFDPKSAESIFEPFKRLHRREDYPGSGLGLAVSKRIVELHGGAMSASSRPGRGSTFCVSLPAVR